jgi:TolB-like protein
MAREVRSAWALIDTGSSPQARALTRLIVLPFRVLRPDPETDFLAFSVPDAITGSLSGLDALVVRSTAAGQRFASDAPDLKAIAAEAGVDVVVTGTLLRAGDQVRVATQMLEAPSGTLLCSSTAQVSLTDTFQLQDDVARRIVESLAIPLSARDQRMLGQHLPVSAKAYEIYLRANHLGAGTSNPSRLMVARDLYRSCLEEDPGYAPAWARLGRVYRVLAKYGAEGRTESLALAEEAFRRALEINPDLQLAHNFYTYFEIEERGRAPEAMLRLLERVGSGAADPHLFAGLVVACRFCGLLEASLAADRRARRIDPAIQTSVQYTYWALGDYPQAALHDVEDIQAVRHGALWMQGREAEALAGVREALTHAPGSLEYWIVESQLAAMEGRKEDCVRHAQEVLDAGFHDPEGLLLHVRELAHVGEVGKALALLDLVVQGGVSLSHRAHSRSLARFAARQPRVRPPGTPGGSRTRPGRGGLHPGRRRAHPGRRGRVAPFREPFPAGERILQMTLASALRRRSRHADSTCPFDQDLRDHRRAAVLGPPGIHPDGG